MSAPPAWRDRPLRGWRAVSCALALLALIGAGSGRWLFEVSAPPMQWVFRALAPDLQLLSLQAPGGHPLPPVQAVVTLARPTHVGAHLMQPHPLGRASAEVRLGQLLQGPAVLALLVLGWPGSAAVTARRLLWALPLGAGLWLLDAPLVLAGMVWQLMLEAYAPEASTLLTRGADFLQNGGRLALAAVIGLALTWRPTRSF